MAEPEVQEVVQVPDELRQARDFLRQHGTTLATGVVVAAVILGGSVWIRQNRVRAAQRAAVMLSTARSVQDLESLLGRYPRSEVAPLAVLKLGKLHFANETYDLALVQYETFRREHGDHLLAPAAEMGRLHCLEALGRSQEALEGFSRFATAHPDSFRVPQAVLGRARCLEQLGRPAEARVVYEDFLADEKYSDWAPAVDTLIESLDRRLAKARSEAPAVAAPRLPGP